MAASGTERARIATGYGTGRVPLLAAGLLVLWAALWLGINTGPYRLRADGWWADLQAYRALVPLAVAGLGAVLVWRHRRVLHVRRGDPTTWLLVYAALGLVGTLVASPARVDGLYWAFAFAAPLFVVLLATNLQDPGAVRHLVRTNWAAVIVLLGLLFLVGLLQGEIARVVTSSVPLRLFGSRPENVGTVWANANGVGRYAAVAGLVAGARLLSGKAVGRWWWAGVLALALGMMLLTRSRSTLLGASLAGAALLVLYRGRKGALVAGGTAALGLLTGLLTGSLVSYLRRGETLSYITSLSGRSHVWAAALEHLPASPLVGFGFQADRVLLGEHLHDAWFQALFQAGLLGLAAFAIAWLLTARSALGLGLLRGYRGLDATRRHRAIEATVVLVFLGVRSLTESTAAFFGVDLILFAPLAALLHGLGTPSTDRTAETAGPVPPERRLRVVVSAFSCAPPGAPSFDGGEALLGWSLVTHLADHHEVHALVSHVHRADIEARRHELPATLSFHYIDMPRPLEALRRRQGGVQLYAYLWQVRALFEARRLHRRLRLDLVHHLTYANDWMGSPMGAFLRVPYVRGPGGGAHSVPEPLREAGGTRFARVQRARSTLQEVLRADPVFVLSQDRARAILTCTWESFEALPHDHRERAELFPVNGIDLEGLPQAQKKGLGPFVVVSAGKLLQTKGFDLGLGAFARIARGREAQLHLYGDGPERARLEDLARQLGVAHQVHFHGWQPRDVVLDAMAAADVFLFPSLRDGGGAVVVEAMAVATPVVCLDLAGPGLHVDATCGVKVPPTTPEETVEGLAGALARLADDPTLSTQLGEGGQRRAAERYPWAVLAARLDRIYRQAAAPPVETVEIAHARS